MKSKLLKKDYNQELEEISENKKFNKDAQNLLLSMFYKVEGAYDDYKTAKREVPSKEEFLERIIYIVKNYCKEIEIAKPNSLLEKELEKSKCKILEENDDEQKVIFFPNEKVVLYSIIKSGIKKMKSSLSLEEKAILMAIQIGKCIGYSEVIRDFNGFSWSIVVNEIENIPCNVIYTDLIYLLGENYISNIDSSNIEELKKLLTPELYNEIKKVALSFYLSYDENQRKKAFEDMEKDKKTLEKMQNQEEFIENISNEKKDMLATIKKIDETLNNPNELRQEYIQKNKKLPNEEKIFSISHYEEKLQEERKNLLNEIENCNKFQNPIEFVKIKNELENKINYYNDLKNVTINKLQEYFLEVFKNKIEKETSKEQLLNYVYEIRYLKFLPISQTEKMKDKYDFEKIERLIIKKGIEKDLITPISNNEDTDYILLKSIFETQDIKLEDLLIKLVVEKEKLKSEIYDGDMLDSTNFITIKKGSNIQLRKTKKVKIFT